MNKVKFYIPLILLPFLLLSCKSNSTYEPVETYKFVYGDMDENVMPISGWIAPSCKKGNNTLEQYKILKESGLNSIYGHYEVYGYPVYGEDKEGNPKTYDGSEEIYKALDYAQQVGVKYFVRDGDLFHLDGEDFINAFEARGYTKYSSFAGFHYTDEPKTHEAFVSISEAYEKFKKYVPQKYAFYVNLNPIEYWLNNGGKAQDYIDSINDYVDTVNPRFLSYDYYAPIGTFPNMKKTYFQQLKIFSTVAAERKLPFWAFALATSHHFGDIYTGYRIPTEADINFQVNTILAYGAKAVQYFCYQTPASDSSTEFYIGQGGSVVDENGNKSTIFEYIKNINAYVSFVDHLLMNSTKIGILSHEDVPCCYLAEKSLKTIRDVESLSSKDNILVSVFDYNGKTLYYCVNTSLKVNATFTLNFIDNLSFNIYPMSCEKETRKENSFTSTLLPGQAVILETI